MNYDVILNANDSATLETQYAFTQGDYGQIQFSIRVKADGQYVTNAQRAYIVFTLSNGMIVTGADMPKSVATYTYVFKGNELQSPGKVVADVKLVYANGQISSNKFTFMCRFDPLADKSVPAAPYITVLQQIVDEGQEKINYLQALIDAMQGSIGSTAITRNDLQNTRNPVSAGAKAIDAQMAQYILLKEDLVNQFLNDSSKPASVALAYSLKQTTDTLNSNLALKANASDLANYYILAGGKTMYAQDDLNNYRNVGVFHCATSDTAQYISNQPSSSKRAFRMVVEDSAGVSSYRRQTLRYFNDDITHSRTYNADNQTWAAWSSK